MPICKNAPDCVEGLADQLFIFVSLYVIQENRTMTSTERSHSESQQEHFIVSSDSISLFSKYYQAKGQQNAPTMMIVHGMSEHSARYAHVAEAFQKEDWNVVISDLRGHGKSGGVPTHISHFDEYLNDLEAVREHYLLDFENSFLLGHSMGALLAALFVEKFPGRFRGLVMFSPLLRVSVPIPRRTVALGKVLTFVAPKTRFRSRVPLADTTRNLKAIQERVSDPLAQRSVTAKWYFAMRKALKEVWENAGRIQIPVLLMQAGQDRIVDPHAASPWLERTSSPHKELKILPDHLHELHHEADWADTLKLVIDWLEIHNGMGIADAVRSA